jgi:DNA uptake protein ComE-like DNA-binding protein
MKSHFKFSKSQRNGVFLLFLLIVLLQCFYFYVDFSDEEISIDTIKLEKFNKEIDSLRSKEIESRKPKIYPFNPNYISDYKGAALGMSSQEIDKLLAFRNQDKWINSTEQFQEVTGISDSLLNAVAPYFKFPEWITNPKESASISFKSNDAPKTFAQKQDLNKATAKQLQSINGIGEYYSDRIVKFRNTFVGGFIADVQLQDVYGLTPEVIGKITKEFTVKTPRVVQKINLNTATTAQLVTIQHIDYDLAHRILEYRELHEGFNSMDELTKVKDFPINKIEIIKLYLSLY